MELPLDKWLASEWNNAQKRLDESGALLFRGFSVPDVDHFRASVTAADPEMLDYEEPSTPRSEVGGKVFTSTEYPSDQRIPLHNEMAYRRSWPRLLWFWCGVPAEQGGETPLADYRRVHDRLPEEIRAAFSEKGVMYERRFNTGFDLTWQHVFGTGERDMVERKLKGDGVEFAWLSDDRLLTRTTVEGVLTHPRTGEKSWFNQVNLFHPSSLDPEVRSGLEAAFGVDGHPRTAKFGDGSEIPERMLAEIRSAIDAETILPKWEAHDVLVVDNLSVAHGREPFHGNRRVCVAMTGAMESAYAHKNKGELQ
ncbi:TauD/TfdA family dioxygenase [Streptomyces sp. NPDC014646]|uniref:TauD/TfdA family dioxygenase n=1 Tax=Streptomyces sp. NPDC014646 TaxID=3364877 RepID=UPI0036F5689A